MRSSIVADAIVYTRREALMRPVVDHLKMKGVSNILNPDSNAACKDALDRFPKALLVLDWEVGAPGCVTVLAHNRKRYEGQLRPILLVVPHVSEQVVATAAEYSVSQIFTEAPTLRNLGARLSAMMLGESVPDEIRDILAEVHAARSGGDLKGAIQLLQKTLAKHPTNLRLKCEAAETLLRLGEPDKALKLLAGMDKTKPPYLRGIHLLGRCLLRLDRGGEAVHALEQATLINPHDVDRLVDLGWALVHQDRLQDASVRFDEALDLSPGNKRALLGKGQAKLMDGKVNEALALVKDVAGELELASLFNTSAVLSMRFGRHEDGMRLYQSALAALGKQPSIQARLHFNMGIGYRRWGKKDKAQQAFAESLQLDPSFTKAHEQLAALAGRSDGPAKKAPKLQQEPPASAADALIKDAAFGFGSLFDEDLEENLYGGKKPA